MIQAETRMAGMTNEEMTAAVRGGDEGAFKAVVDRHRPELQVHCYRMLGSFHDAEDVVQETFLRAWKYRDSLKNGAPVRPWLYRIATNASLDAIARDERRVAVDRGVGGGGAAAGSVAAGEVTWLQPYPDRLLEAVAPPDAEPDARVVRKETIELAFLTVIQLLTGRQRAAFILRDVLGWSAKETAELLEVSEAAANSALQRAREALAKHLPTRKPEWPAGVDPTAAERQLLKRYIAATENADIPALEALLREDVTFRMPPEPGVYAGRDTVVRNWIDGGFGSPDLRDFRCVITRANLQPAVAAYRIKPGETTPRALAMDVLRIEDGLIAEIITFSSDVFEAFDLPATL